MVYLLHFDRKYKHAQHYIGFVTCKRNLKLRLAHHRNGSGARIMKVVTDAGIDFKLSRTWDDADRNFERKLKNGKHSSRLCPICQGVQHDNTA